MIELGMAVLLIFGRTRVWAESYKGARWVTINLGLARLEAPTAPMLR